MVLLLIYQRSLYSCLFRHRLYSESVESRDSNSLRQTAMDPLRPVSLVQITALSLGLSLDRESTFVHSRGRNPAN